VISLWIDISIGFFGVICKICSPITDRFCFEGWIQGHKERSKLRLVNFLLRPSIDAVIKEPFWFLDEN
jgi:hypothetical protein